MTWDRNSDASGRGLPAPDSDPTNQPYWDAAREGRFVLPKCATCHHVMAPPVANCSVCLGRTFEWITSSGRGSVYSFIEYFRAYMPQYEGKIPYVVAVIALDEGPRMIAGIVRSSDQGIHVDARVSLVFQERDGGARVPMFALA
jgi:uncharacterized protein